MDARSAKAFAQFSLLLVVVGMLVGDPLAAFFFFIVAGILNVLALALGTKRVRLFALIFLVIIIVLAVWQYPAARRHFERYRDRVHANQLARILPLNQPLNLQAARLYCIPRPSALI
jgi:hypothetical protein